MSEPEINRESGDNGGEDYSFMTETVRKRPGRWRKGAMTLLAVLAGGVAFGVTSGLIFRALNPSAAEYISFESDTTEAEGQESAGPDEEASADSGSDSDGSDDGADAPEVTETPSPEAIPEATETPTPEVTPEPTPEPTPEELKAAQIANYKELYAAMAEVADASEKSLVNVQGITSTEDWFDTVTESRKTMSGLIIADVRDALIILTDREVTADVERITVSFFDGYTVDASVQRTDPVTGLTVLRAETAAIRAETRSALTVADLGNSYALKRGQPVIAIGRPVGTDNGLAYGEVTSLGDTIALTDCRYIRVTTDIYGSSDGSGFLIDLDGRFVGIIEPAYAPEGSNTVAAIAISPVKAVIERITNNEEISYLGIRGDNVTSQLSADTGIPIGVYVTGFDENSPAAVAGLQVADVITGINEDTVNSMEAYQRLLMAKRPGEEITLVVQRLGAEGFVPIEFTMTVSGV